MPKSKPVFTFFSLLILLFSSFLFPLFSFAETETEETLTITTYYPAPYGVYNEMRSKRMAVGDNYINGSTFSWDAGTIDANADLVVEGNVGIGTVIPQAKLDVAGGIKADGKIKIGDDSSAPTAGAIRWTGSDLEVYDGTEWKSLTAKSEGGLPFYGTDHTKQDCQNAGGMVANYQTNSFCKFTASSCPSGWTRYQNLGSTSTNSCAGASKSGPYCLKYDHKGRCEVQGTYSCPASSCMTESHFFSNLTTETCGYNNKTEWRQPRCHYFDSRTCAASLIEVGCY